MTITTITRTTVIVTTRILIIVIFIRTVIWIIIRIIVVVMVITTESPILPFPLSSALHSFRFTEATDNHMIYDMTRYD